MPITRRTVLSGLAAAPMAAAPIAAAGATGGKTLLDPRDQARRDAMALAALMQSIHGGSWGTIVSHRGFIMISRHAGEVPAEELHRVIAEDGTITDTWVPVA